MPEEVLAFRPEISVEELLEGLTLSRMHSIFKDIMRRQKERIDPVRSGFGTLEKEEVDMDATWERTERYILEHGTCSFRELLGNRSSKMQIVVTFLVVLELMKIGKIKISQEDTFADIYIRAAEKEEEKWN